MTKKLIFAILGFLLIAVACRNEEAFTNYETQKQELISKSLWKEDLVYIGNVKSVFEKDFNQSNFANKFGLPSWEFAMSFGNFNESFLRVPLIKNRKVASIMQVVRNKDNNKIYFSHTEDSASLEFFQNLIFTNYKKLPKADKVIPNPNNETGRTLSIENCSTRTFSFEVGCLEPYQNTENCPKKIEYRTVTTCTITTLFLLDDDPAGWTGDYSDGGHEYPTGGNGNTDQTTTNPCEKIKTQRNDDSFKKRIDTLQGKTGLKKETGYIQKFGGDYVYKDNANSSNDANSLSLPEVETNTYIKGFMHTHVDNYTITYQNGDTEERIGIKAFSPADVGYFMDLVNNAFSKGINLGEVYGTMVTSGGNYQIRFTGNQYQIKTFTKEQLDTFRSDYIKFMESFIGNAEKLEKGFLFFISEKMNLKAISLYRLNPDNTTSEVKLNVDKTTIIESKCPN